MQLRSEDQGLLCLPGWLSNKDLVGEGNYKSHMTSLVLGHGAVGSGKQTKEWMNK